MRLRTLILLRWLAILGQTATIVVAWRYYGIDLDLTACFLTVGVAVAVNLAFILAFPATRRLSESEALFSLLLDTGQLAVLLFLTGGLDNPFALLILAPVTIAGAALRTQATVLIGLITIIVVTLLVWLHIPLSLRDGTPITIPPIFSFGFWLAIVIGVIFLGLYSRRVASEIHTMGEALLATQMALAREQKLTDLGGVVAAAAHELGTPLATIKLASSELADELRDRPDLRSDAELIRQQADRCRDILHSMGRAGKDDLHLRAAPISAVIREAAEPHADRGKTLHFSLGDSPEHGKQPLYIHRRPEIIHGLRNLIQNAVDFSTSSVWIDGIWDERQLTVRISDDGAGYPPHLIGRIGDPFVGARREDTKTAGREGMGLGLFIAKTLLERSGANLSFRNGADPFLAADERPDRSGAIVEVRWDRRDIEMRQGDVMGENTRFPI
ncbi:MAG: ActS/PrrB/RegB family redox-sensitive histidine kinase [Paracoccaceae bacterium]